MAAICRIYGTDLACKLSIIAPQKGSPPNVVFMVSPKPPALSADYPRRCDGRGLRTCLDADAQGRSETLLVVQELGPNSLDMQGVGSNQTVNGLSWNCYDRLMTYGVEDAGRRDAVL